MVLEDGWKCQPIKSPITAARVLFDPINLLHMTKLVFASAINFMKLRWNYPRWCGAVSMQSHMPCDWSNSTTTEEEAAKPSQRHSLKWCGQRLGKLKPEDNRNDVFLGLPYKHIFADILVPAQWYQCLLAPRTMEKYISVS